MSLYGINFFVSLGTGTFRKQSVVKREPWMGPWAWLTISLTSWVPQRGPAWPHQYRFHPCFARKRLLCSPIALQLDETCSPPRSCFSNKQDQGFSGSVFLLIARSFYKDVFSTGDYLIFHYKLDIFSNYADAMWAQDSLLLCLIFQ